MGEPTRSCLAPGAEVILGLRPEHLVLDGGAARIALTADLSESLGGSTLVYGQTRAGETVSLQAPGRRMLRKGEALSVGFDPAQAYLFDASGRAI